MVPRLHAMYVYVGWMDAKATEILQDFLVKSIMTMAAVDVLLRYTN